MMTSCLKLPVYRDTLPDINPGDPGYDEVVRVKFLGVGGFAIRRGDDAILTAPLYSNPSLGEVLGARLTSKANRIEQFHPAVPNVKAILVGHAHYDHLMDVPQVWEKTPQATIYGNRSMENILAGYASPGETTQPFPVVPADKVVALNDNNHNVVDYRMCAAAEKQPRFCAQATNGEGAWLPVPQSRVRIRALCSTHPPQFLRLVHLWKGCVASPRRTPPGRTEDWKEGDTFVYLIDFLGSDGRTPVFRIYYQDAPTGRQVGHVPPQLLDEKAVDLALLCVGSFESVDDPASIVKAIQPRYVILGHWEDFFRPQDKRLNAIPFADVKAFLKKVEEAAPQGTQVWLPAPQAEFHLGR